MNFKEIDRILASMKEVNWKEASCFEAQMDYIKKATRKLSEMNDRLERYWEGHYCRYCDNTGICDVADGPDDSRKEYCHCEIGEEKMGRLQND